MPLPESIKYKRLKQTHPRVNLTRLRQLRAMYRGGAVLLNDQRIMSSIFPRYTYEPDTVYKERCDRAYYENLFALVINQMSSGLAQDPAHMVPAIEPSPDQPIQTQAIPQYWLDLGTNATAPDEDGSEQRTLDQVLRDLCVEGLTCGWAWIQVDMPQPAGVASSRAEQDATGDLDAYLCTWPTDQVIDWETNEGALLWLKTYECQQVAATVDADRDVTRHIYTVWDDQSWATYVVEESKSTTDPKRLPNDDEFVAMKSSGVHAMGRVPWLMLDFCAPNGMYLHVGDFIESSCRSYFNRSNGETYQQTQYNFQQLYEFLGPESGDVDNEISDAQRDPGRAKRGRRGPGQIHVRGQDDRAEFVGPDMGGADAGRSALQDQRDSILRMTNQMALAQDTSGAMLRRSGDSKAQDAQAQQILLGAVGKRLLTIGEQILALIGMLREEDPPKLEGYEKFSIDSTADEVAMAVQLEQIQIPSASYQVEHKYRLAVMALGDAASDELKLKIHDELEQAITQDNLNWTQQPPGAEIPEEGQEEEDPDAEEEDAEDPSEEAA